MKDLTPPVQVLGASGEGFEGLEIDGLGLEGTLTLKQTRFVHEYISLGNGTAAAIAAGYSENTAAEISSENLRKPQIRKAIADRMIAAAKLASVDAAMVVAELYDIATADPTEHCRTVIDCCRFCWGIDHKYQWTPGEYEDELDRALAAGKPAPGLKGGLSFDPRKEPHLECPECVGRGVLTVVYTPSRKVSKGARKLLSSVKQSKDGSIELKMRDQDKALQLLGSFCGLWRDRQELSGPGGAPLQVAPAPAFSALTNEQLEDILRKRGQPLPPKQLTDGGNT